MASEGVDVVRDLQSSFDRTEETVPEVPVTSHLDNEPARVLDEAEAPAPGPEGEALLLEGTVDVEGGNAEPSFAGDSTANEPQGADDVEAAEAPEDEKENLGEGDAEGEGAEAVPMEEPSPAPIAPAQKAAAPPRLQTGPTAALLERMEISGRPAPFTAHTAFVAGPESPGKTPRQAGGQATKKRWAPAHSDGKKPAPSPAPGPSPILFSNAPTLRTARSPQRASRTLDSGVGSARKPLDVYAIKGMRLAQSEQLRAQRKGTGGARESANPGITPDVQAMLAPRRPGRVAAGVRQASSPTGDRPGSRPAPPRTAGSPPHTAGPASLAPSRGGTGGPMGAAAASAPPSQDQMEGLMRAAAKFSGSIHLSSQISGAPAPWLEEQLQIPEAAHMTDREIVAFHEQRGFDFTARGGFLTDPQFPPSVHALFPDPDRPPPTGPLASAWTRIQGPFYTRFQSPQLRWDARLGNLWLVNALGALACHEDLLLSSFVSEDLGDRGLFSFQFFKHGQWVPVTVDDHIPFEPGRDHPQFLRSDRAEGGGDTWPPLVEKAYAKLRGSYYGMDGTGTLGQALTELTGNPVQRIDLEPPPGPPAKDADAPPESRHLPWLEACLRHGDVLVAKISAPSLLAEGMKTHASGLYYNHAYTVLAVHRPADAPGDAVIKCFNPWRGGAYTPTVQEKRFSDYEDASRPGTAESYPRGARGAAAAPLPDTAGDIEHHCFFIPAAEFFATFTRVYRVVHIPASWNQVALRGAWFGRTAGGPPALADQPNGAFCTNPQYRVTARKACDVIVHVSIKDPNLLGAGAFEDGNVRGLVRPPRFEVLALASEPLDYTRKFLVNPRELLCYEPMPEAGGLDLTAQFHLKAGTAAVIVPYTEAPGLSSAFALRFFTSAPIEVEELTTPETATVVGGWEGVSAGGGPDFSSWGSNPQYLIQPQETTKIMVQLEPAEPSKPSHILDDEDEDEDDLLDESYGYLSMSYRFNQSLGLGTSVTSNVTGRTGGGVSTAPPPEGTQRLSSLDMPPSTISSHGREALGEPSRANSSVSQSHNTGPYNRTQSQSTHVSNHGSGASPMRGAQKKRMALIVCKPTEVQGGGLGRRLFLSSSLQEVLAQTAWVRLAQQTSLSILLTCGVPIMLCPTIRFPGVPGRFKMSIYSQTPLQVFELPPARTVTVTGEWTEIKSGGCDLHKTFKKNPAFVLTVKGRGPVQLSVHRADAKGVPLTAAGAMGDKGIDRMAGFYVFEAAKPPSRGQGAVLPADALGSRVFESSFVPTVQVTGEVVLGTAAPETVYYLLAATYSPNQMGRFLVTATATVDLDLYEYAGLPVRVKRDSQIA